MSESPSAPNDAEVEKALLGTLLLFPGEAGPLILQTLRPSDFFHEGHQVVARLLMQAFEDARNHDAVTLSHALRSEGVDLGVNFIPDIMDAAPTCANVERMVTIVKELALTRGVINAGAELKARGQALHTDGVNGKRVSEVLADHRVRVEDLERESIGANTMKSWTAPELLDADIPEPISLVGNHLLDQGGLSIISGKGGLGKSNLMLALCVDQSAGGGKEWLRVPLPAEPLRTLYLWGEGGSYFAKKRLHLLEAEARQAPGCRVVVPREVTPDLRESSAVAELKQLLTSHKPHLVVIDHISEWSGGMNDSDNATAGFGE